jgi:hypothetical protein
MEGKVRHIRNSMHKKTPHTTSKNAAKIDETNQQEAHCERNITTADEELRSTKTKPCHLNATESTPEHQRAVRVVEGKPTIETRLKGRTIETMSGREHVLPPVHERPRHDNDAARDIEGNHIAESTPG